jgi:hypothetical protein
MGELGFVTPWLAAWMPVIVFGACHRASRFAPKPFDGGNCNAIDTPMTKTQRSCAGRRP